MADFDLAINVVLKNEGDLSEDSADPGGITNFGISLRFLREVSSDGLKRAGIFNSVDDKTIRNLTLAQAKILYKIEFWDQAPFENISNQELANYVFDMCVNMGISQGIRLLQRAVNSYQKKINYLKDDGVFGPVTLAAVNALGLLLLPTLIAQREGFYRTLVAVNSSQKVFLNGWLTRTYNV